MKKISRAIVLKSKFSQKKKNLFDHLIVFTNSPKEKEKKKGKTVGIARFCTCRNVYIFCPFSYSN